MQTGIDGVETIGVASSASSVAPPAQAAKPVDGERSSKAAKRSKRQAAKLRAVWISFTGRIVAQFVGSAASILLGMMLIHSYKEPAQGAHEASLVPEPAAYEGRVARPGETGGNRRPSIVVLPFEDYSLDTAPDRFAQAMTESVTAAMADRGSLAVLSRTSASLIGARQGSVPAIAREAGVDLVLESSVTRSANRIRVVAQLIDGRSDEHLWIGRYDGEPGDILGLQGGIADQIARGIDAVVGGSVSRPATIARRSTGAGSGPDF
jgi:TolB-like protein